MTLFYNLNPSLKQLKLIIRPTLKQRVIIVVTRKVTTQVHRLFQRKKNIVILCEQMVLQLPGTLTAYTLFSHQNINFKKYQCDFNIITYTHSFRTFNNKKKPLKMGIQGNNLHIFL